MGEATATTEIENLARWLIKQAQAVPYGSIGVEITLHAGKIVKTSKAVSESKKPG